MNARVRASGLLGGAVYHVVVVLVDDRPEGAGDRLNVDAAAMAHRVQLALA